MLTLNKFNIIQNNYNKPYDNKSVSRTDSVSFKGKPTISGQFLGRSADKIADVLTYKYSKVLGSNFEKLSQDCINIISKKGLVVLNEAERNPLSNDIKKFGIKLTLEGKTSDVLASGVTKNEALLKFFVKYKGYFSDEIKTKLIVINSILEMFKNASLVSKVSKNTDKELFLDQYKAGLKTLLGEST